MDRTKRKRTPTDKYQPGADDISAVLSPGSTTLLAAVAGSDFVADSTAGSDSVADSTAGSDSLADSTAGSDSAVDSTVGSDSAVDSTAGLNSDSAADTLVVLGPMKRAKGRSTCPHGRRKHQYKECGGSGAMGICLHGRRKHQCTIQ